MQFIGYIVLYPFLWLISVLPFRVLYILSDIFRFIIQYVIGYRKKVIEDNLRLVFPEKSEAEIKRIRQKFYKHFCDVFIEMIKTLNISKTQLNKRFVIKNPEVLAQLESYNTSAVLMYGHYASYEWSIVIQSHLSIGGLAIYKKLANIYFDRLVRKIRSRYKTDLVNTLKALKKIDDMHKTNDYKLIGFLSDQSPKIKPTNVWLPFMGINIPCFIGAELTAKKYNFPVGFLEIEKVKRGYYEANFVFITDNASETEEYEITKKFNQLLEAQIRQAPEFYLWTHKRWKHRDLAPNNN